MTEAPWVAPTGDEDAASCSPPVPSSRGSKLGAILFAGDLSAAAIGWSLLLVLPTLGDGAYSGHLVLFTTGVVLTLLALTGQRLYRSRICAIRSVELQRLTRAVLIATVGTAVVHHLAGPGDIGHVAWSGAAVLLLLMIERSLYRSWLQRRRRRGEATRRVVLVGSDDEASTLKRSLDEHPEFGISVCGFAAPASEAHRCEELDAPWLGPVAQVPDLLTTVGASGVVIVAGSIRPDETESLVRTLLPAGFHVHVSSGLHHIAPQRLRPIPLAYAPLLYVEPIALRHWQARIKRLTDIVVGSLTLVAVTPILLLAALAIKLEDGGPVVFRQSRVGLHNKPFDMLKLRTMTVDAEARLPEIAQHNQRTDSPLFKVAQDPRVTRCGRLLRRTSIDEFPQLFNVLRGDMSLVGPRPALASEAELFDASLHRRVSVRPGITGLWQVEARDNPAFGPYHRLDLYYVENWSLGLDLSILAATAFTVLARTLSAVQLTAVRVPGRPSAQSVLD